MTTLFAIPPAADALRQATDKRLMVEREALLKLSRSVEPAIRGAIEAGRVNVTISDQGLPATLRDKVRGELAKLGYISEFHNGRGSNHLTIHWETPSVQT